MNSARPRKVGALNWHEARTRLARAIAATADAQHLSPERARAVLDERARTLARPPLARPTARLLEVATFQLAGERCAIETRYIYEIIRWHEPARLPGVPEHLAGLINLRGEIIAVFDLRKLLGIEPKEPTEHARVLVLGGERAELGVLADAAETVLTLSQEEMQPPPASVACGDHYLGVAPDGLIVLNGQALLADPRLFIEDDPRPGRGTLDERIQHGQ
jgi:purine-binding chemotaxis protein CheW